METRANHVWVGAVTLMLLALLAAFFVWLVQLGGADQKEYDIFFPQSVGGLANGSEVTFQGGALFSMLTVAENVEVPLKQFYPELDPELLHEIARYKVKMSGLPEDAASKYPSELSGGMRKRAGLARALALDPELLFLDEPTAGLDPIGASAFDELTRELQETLGLTVFLITHDLDTLHAICDRVAVLADGKVIAIGPISELLDNDHPWIQEYFNGPRGRAAQIGFARAEGNGKSVDKPSRGKA